LAQNSKINGHLGEKIDLLISKFVCFFHKNTCLWILSQIISKYSEYEPKSNFCGHFQEKDSLISEIKIFNKFLSGFYWKQKDWLTSAVENDTNVFVYNISKDSKVALKCLNWGPTFSQLYVVLPWIVYYKNWYMSITLLMIVS